MGLKTEYVIIFRWSYVSVSQIKLKLNNNYVLSNLAH